MKALITLLILVKGKERENGLAPVGRFSSLGEATTTGRQ